MEHFATTGRYLRSQEFFPMASPSSPIVHSSGRCQKLNSINLKSRLRRNSLVSDHDDIMLLREKLTRIAVDRRYESEAVDDEQEETEERRRGGRSRGGSTLEHFQVFSLLPPERPNTPPSSPQPRDVLRKQLKLKQHVVTSWRQRKEGEPHDEKGEAMVKVDEVEVMPMEDVEAASGIHSPRPRGYKRNSQARLSIPGHLRALSSFSILNKHPEGWRKRKCAHVDVADDGQVEPRASLKKTSSQINILAATKGKFSRSSSASGSLYQKFAAKQRLEQDQEMEDVGCTTQPGNALFGNKHGQLSACS